MYNESYDYYDLFYYWKNYKKEADKVIEIIDKYDAIFKKKTKSQTLLDIGCGTGEHHRYMKRYFSIDGLDIKNGFLGIAKKKNPECNYYEGDMINFSLDKKYDIIISLFSSIAYVKTTYNLHKSIRCFYRHLNPSGLLIIEPWFTPDAWIKNKITTNNIDKDHIKICRMTKSSREGNISIMDMNYLIGSKTQGIQYIREEHQMGLFTVDDMKKSFTDNGFNVEYNAKGISDRGVYIGKKTDI